MLLDRMVRAMGSVPQSQTTMSAMLTMLATSAVFLFDGGCAVALLFILVCGVALLQSRLIKAAGHWTQHGASAIQLNNSRNMSRTCTSAAELFYLRHTRSCAATACGSKGGGATSARSAATEHTAVDARADDALAEPLRSPTQVAKESTATEHASAEFCIEAAMDETLRRIKTIHGNSEILVRVVDHACSSDQCVSHRIAAMFREASWKISEDLFNDQPLDACGYIAADAVCRLREAALAEANGWHRMKLPDYARLECVGRGNQVLRKRDRDRILDSDQVKCKCLCRRGQRFAVYATDKPIETNA